MTTESDQETLRHYNLHPTIKNNGRIGDATPNLPEIWVATSLANPYVDDTVRAVRTVCNHANGRMLHESYGVDGTAFRLFYVGDELYLFTNEDDRQQRRAVGPIPQPIAVPGADIFEQKGLENQGGGYLLNQKVDFHLGYSPNANGYEHTPPSEPTPVCNWVWAYPDEHLMPLRWFFTNHNNPCDIPYLGYFALATFEIFQKGTEANNSLDWAAEWAETATAAPQALLEAMANVKTSKDFHDAIQANLGSEYWQGQEGQAGKIITGLGPAISQHEPEWNGRLKMTGFTYQTAHHPDNYPIGVPAMPLRVYYHWPKSGVADAHMLTHCSLDQYEWSDTDHLNIYLDANGNDTFIMKQDGSNEFMGHDKTGIVKYNWASQDFGTAKATIKDNPVICPGETLNITTLPNDQRHFWVWYTPDNKGQLFMEIPQMADVLLVLTDYYTYDLNPEEFPKDWWKEPAHNDSA